MSKVIELKNVSLQYSDSKTPTLKDVSLSVEAGEIVVIVGPSGCGKTTLIKIVNGLEKATKGSVAVPDRVSMVFQTGALFPWLTVRDNIAIVLEAQKLPRGTIDNKCLEYLKLVGLSEHSARYPRDLSGGQRQRVGIARALAIEPQVLILDEPFSALDIKTTDELHTDLLDICAKTHQTILMISHSIEEAVTLADRIVLMVDGRIDHIFDLSNLKRPRRESANQFITDVENVRRRLLEVA